jgi:myo-inositol-hexaphosphate 3-phosphohydrolase
MTLSRLISSICIASLASLVSATHSSFRGVRTTYNNTGGVPFSDENTPSSTRHDPLRATLEAKAAQYSKAVRNLHVISSDDVRRTVQEAQLKETLRIPNDIQTPDRTLFGGISGITYDNDRKVYYALTNDVESSHEPELNLTEVPTSNFSDSPCRPQWPDWDCSQNSAAASASSVWPNFPYPSSTNATHRPRFYTLKLDDVGNAQIIDVTYLRDANHREYEAGDVIPQAIAYADGQIYISLDTGPNSRWNGRPEIVEFNSTGHYQAKFNYPDYFRPDVGFTALTITPKEDILYAATGRGLRDDRPNYIRIVELNIETRQSGNQYVYEAEETVVGMVSLDDNGGFAILERSDVNPEYDPTLPPFDNLPTYPVSRSEETRQWEGYDASLYYALALDAIDVQSVNDLKDVHTLKTMRRVTMYEWQNVTKFEAMGNDAGYRKKGHDDEETSKSTRSHQHMKDEDNANLRRKLKSWEDELDIIIMSDNQFNPAVPTDIIIMELDAKVTAVLEPHAQTADVIDDGAVGKFALDPAIWVHPSYPEFSLIIAALSMSDIGVYSLKGELKQRVVNDGDPMGVDVMYAFKMGNEDLMDIAIVSDGTNNHVRIYKIQTNNGDNYLTGITDGSMPTIERPRGVSAYHSPFTGKQYVFVQSRDDFIVQMELKPTNDNERVTGSIVREIYLPSKSGGLVVDDELGFLYVSLPDNYDMGIIKYDAEPNEYKDYENYPVTIVSGHEEYFSQGGIKGLTLYYGDKGDGFLVVSVSGDSTFAVFEREKDNQYYDSFTIGKNSDDGVDKTDNTQGIAITNLKLGSDFQCGLFVAQDFDNAKAKVDGLPVGELVNSNTNFKLGA